MKQSNNIPLIFIYCKSYIRIMRPFIINHCRMKPLNKVLIFAFDANGCILAPEDYCGDFFTASDLEERLL